MQVQHCLCFHRIVALWRYREVSGGRQFTLFVKNHRSVVATLCNDDRLVYNNGVYYSWKTLGFKTTKRRIDTPAIDTLLSHNMESGSVNIWVLGWLLVQHCSIYMLKSMNTHWEFSGSNKCVLCLLEHCLTQYRKDMQSCRNSQLLVKAREREHGMARLGQGLLLEHHMAPIRILFDSI